MKRWSAQASLAAAVALAAQTAGVAAPRAALPAPAAIPLVALPVGVSPLGALPAPGAPLSSLGALSPASPGAARISAWRKSELAAPLGKPMPAAPLPAAPAKPAEAPLPSALSGLHRVAIQGAAIARAGITTAATSSLAGRLFDGAAARGSGAESPLPASPAVQAASSGSGSADSAPAPQLPSYLAVPYPDQAAWVAEVWAEAQRSKTGRAILARVQRLAQRRGRPVIVIVAPIGNAGEFAFDHEIVTIDAGFMSHPKSEAAAIFSHELAHVLQLAQGLPTDAFEMELEAYLVQFRVAEELGFKAKRGSFHWSAFTRFKNDVDRFMAWLLKEYDGNLSIVGKGSLADYEAVLAQRHFEGTRKLERLDKRAASKRRVIEKMLATGQPQGLIEQYRLDELAPLEEKLRVQRRELAWMERDLLLLRTPESRARYQRYAERVLRKARAYHARLQSGR